MSGPIGPGSPTPASETLRRAAEVREDWLAVALSTRPADRAAAEAAISELYQGVGEGPPRFLWVDSPAAALELDSGDRPEPDSGRPHRLAAATRRTPWPVACRIAEGWSRLRRRLEPRQYRLFGPRSVAREVSRGLGLEELVHQGFPLSGVLEVAVLDPLGDLVDDAVAGPVRGAFMALDGPALGLRFGGQHEAAWQGFVAARRATGDLEGVPAEVLRLLEPWTALARSCQWWWPGREVCVISERPQSLHREGSAADRDGGFRLHNEDGPAVRYRDGWGVHVLHGTPVPAWVLEDPTVERISAERNVEVRRAAIERIGWDAYLDQGGMRLFATAPDPGNPGQRLRLYDPPPDLRFRPSRMLVATNGSVERDGSRRRYGLTVPDGIDDPVAAAAWTYGLPREVYATLARRT